MKGEIVVVVDGGKLVMVPTLTEWRIQQHEHYVNCRVTCPRCHRVSEVDNMTPDFVFKHGAEWCTTGLAENVYDEKVSAKFYDLFTGTCRGTGMKGSVRI